MCKAEILSFSYSSLVEGYLLLEKGEKKNPRADIDSWNFPLLNNEGRVWKEILPLLGMAPNTVFLIRALWPHCKTQHANPAHTLGSYCIISFFWKRSKGELKMLSFSAEKISIPLLCMCMCVHVPFTSCGISHILFGSVMSSISKKSGKRVPLGIRMWSLSF